jgi:hypothetical protein
MFSSRFTIFTTVASATPAQALNARIIAIAADQTKQNISLIQNRSDLIVRFRTMVTGLNGTTPQFVVANIFRDTLAHTIIATFDEEHLRVYVDDIHHVYSTRLGPGFAFLHRLTPWQRNSSLSPTSTGSVETAFRLVLFLPFGILLGFAFIFFSKKPDGLWRTKTFLDAALIAIGAVLPPFFVEWILSWQLNRPINAEYVLLGAGSIAGTIAVLALLRVWRQRHSRTLGLSFESSDIVHNQLT